MAHKLVNLCFKYFYGTDIEFRNRKNLHNSVNANADHLKPTNEAHATLRRMRAEAKNTDITINMSWKSQHITLDGVTNAINKSSNPINMDTNSP